MMAMSEQTQHNFFVTPVVGTCSLSDEQKNDGY